MPDDAGRPGPVLPPVRVLLATAVAPERMLAATPTAPTVAPTVAPAVAPTVAPAVAPAVAVAAAAAAAAAAAPAPAIGAAVTALAGAGDALLTWSTTAAAAFPSAPDTIPAAKH